MTDDEWRRIMAVNLDGTFYVTRAFIADLEHNQGRVINISSISGREGTSLLAAYCAAKHGVIGLTRALAEELRTAKVSVNAICPGSVDTQMLREGLPGARPDMSPDDIAKTALFLAATAPTALTGACIDVYG
jgi:NAD(P)-dependent dehydrogenase (short-subunit alcohol dehydrogenase family)